MSAVPTTKGPTTYTRSKQYSVYTAFPIAPEFLSLRTATQTKRHTTNNPGLEHGDCRRLPETKPTRDATSMTTPSTRTSLAPVGQRRIRSET